MIDEVHCKNFSIQIKDTQTDITAEEIARVFSWMYQKSVIFQRAVDEIARLGGKVVLSVDDTYISPRTPTPLDPEGDGDGIAGNLDDVSVTQNPDAGIDARINIPTGGYDGDTYLYGVGGMSIGKASLAGILAHEIFHALNDVKQNKGSDNVYEGDQEEVQAELMETEVRVDLKMHVIDPMYNINGDELEGGSEAPHLMQEGMAPPPEIPSGECFVPNNLGKKPDVETIKDVENLFGAGENQASPLILDLDHSGTINLISLANSNAYFDRDLDGFAEVSSIAAGTDGYLALDLNQNGRIDDNSELFGTKDKDGFSILAQYDSNKDGKITADDATWDDLIIWQDVNENGYSEETELYTLADHNIISLNLDATEVSQVNQGNDVTHTGSFTVDAGSGAVNYAMHDVWFKYDNTNTIYVGDYDLDFDALMLPVDLRGYGRIADLYIAVSKDNNGTGNLLELVSDFSEKTFSQIFDGTTDIANDVRDIMFRWAGVDGLSPTSRGAHVDAREITFLETLFDNPFRQGDHQPNPLYNASIDVNNAFDVAFNHFYARLLVQSGGGELFEGDWYYDSIADSIEGVTGLNLTRLGDLETEALGLADTAARQVFWENVVRMVEYSVGTDNLSSGDLNALRAAITDSDAALDLEDDVLPAMGGDTVPYNSAEDQEVYGGNGDDTLYGYGGNDLIEGDSGSDTLIGGTGSDTLRGGYGNDTYIYNDGDGDDIITDRGGSGYDTILFGPGITSSHITMSRAGNDLRIAIDTGTNVSQIMVNDQFNGAEVERIEFDDSTTIDLTTLDYTAYGTAGDDTIWGIRSGGSGVDTIYGGDGNDTINGYAANQNDGNANWLYGEGGNDKINGGNSTDVIMGGSGDDTINGNLGDDFITGGTGDDILKGGAGNDTFNYFLGDGDDSIQEYGGGTDKIIFGAGIDSEDLAFARYVNEDVIISFGTNTITLADQTRLAGNFTIETLEFNDSSTIDLTSIDLTTYGTASNDTIWGVIYGGSGSDTVYGGAGDDIIRGYGPNQNYETTSNWLHGEDGNDSLYGGYSQDFLYGGTGNDLLDGGNGDDYLEGGEGDDTLSGGTGNDIFSYALGDGDDYIQDSGGSLDKIIFGAGIIVGDLSFNRYTNEDVTISFGSNVITLVDQTRGNGSYAIETLEFFDSSTLDLTSINLTTHGTAGNDAIWGVIYGGGGSDTIYGGAGDDVIRGHGPNQNYETSTNWLYGEDGNDSLYGGYSQDFLYGGTGNDSLDGGYGDDYLDGGEGNDTVNGGYGSDIYVYTSGDDTFRDWANVASVDEILMPEGIEESDLTFTRISASDLQIDVAGLGSITIVNQFYNAGHSIETLRFADNSTINLLTKEFVTQGTSGNDNWSGIATGGSSNDTMYMGDGNDSINAGAGNDLVYGENGNDNLNGGDGNDVLSGGAGNDTLTGGNGDDYLDGGEGDDSLIGNAGSDIYVYTSGDDTFNENVNSTGSIDEILLPEGIDESDLTFTRISASNLKIDVAGLGSITIVNQFYSAGYSIETLRFADNSTINLLTKEFVTQGTSGNDNWSGIAAGGSSNDTMYMNDGNDVVNAGDGDDLVYGGNGNDTINGQAGSDTIYGEDGDDNIDGGAGVDFLYGGAGNDTLNGGSGADNDYYFYTEGHDTVWDGWGGSNDIIELDSTYGWSDLTFRRYSSAANDLKIEIDGSHSVTIKNFYLNTTSLVETLRLNDGTGDFSLNGIQVETHGDSGNNTLNGITVNGSINDILYGWGGNDTLNGNTGDDYLNGGTGNDTLNGAVGDDFFVYSAGLDTVTDTSGADTLLITGGVTIDQLSFSHISTYNTKIIINSGTDEVTLNNLRHSNSTYHIETIAFDDGFETTLPSYASWVTGTTGVDIVTGTSGNNTIIGNGGDDDLDGAGGNDNIHGGAGNDTLYGGAGDDLLHGGIGDDALYGQDGLDTLFGGAGADSFVFEDATAFNNVDVIQDFNAADGDMLDLSDLLTGFDPLTDAITDFVQITESSGNSTLLVDRDGIGNVYTMQKIALLSDVTGLTDEAALYTNGTLIAA